jgi:hypothetical protein
MNRRDTADLDVLTAACSVRAPTGSSPRRSGAVPTARASNPSRSSPANSTSDTLTVSGTAARVDLPFWYVFRTAGPLPRGALGGSPEYLPHGRAQVGDRHLNFHETRDNLRIEVFWSDEDGVWIGPGSR